MFVFKAAVVGAGTMGGEIATVIASAGLPVVLKDVDQTRGRPGHRQGTLGCGRGRSMPASSRPRSWSASWR